MSDCNPNILTIIQNKVNKKLGFDEDNLKRNNLVLEKILLEKILIKQRNEMIEK
jgi:hypothetical protein